MSKLEKLLYKFKHLDVHQVSNGAILIGRAPHIASEAWLNEIYPTLQTDDLDELEMCLRTTIPSEYKRFLTEVSNGLSILVAEFSLDGLRRNYDRTVDGNRQPFSLEIPNVHERPRNAKENHLFIGGYKWDGSHLYIDKETSKVHFCDRWDATSLYEWNSFGEMLISEIERIYALYDTNGVKINEDMWTTPIER